MKKSFIALILTNALLIFGILSLLFTVEKHYYYAGILIILAALYKHFEPSITKKLNIHLQEEEKLDSPGLFLIFAIAPMMMIYFLFDFKTLGLLGFLPCLLFPMAGLNQLNRVKASNVKTFTPLLSLPNAGGALGFFALVLQRSLSLGFLLYLTMLIFSYLMIRPKKS